MFIQRKRFKKRLDTIAYSDKKSPIHVSWDMLFVDDDDDGASHWQFLLIALDQINIKFFWLKTSVWVFIEKMITN